MKTKSEIRKEILKQRNALTSREVEEKSKAIAERLKAVADFRNGSTVFIYMDFKNEVRTLPLVKEMLEEGRRVIIPYTDVKNTIIIPVRIRDMDNDLTVSSYGYPEPKEEIIKPVDPQEFDIIIVPGVAFGRDFNRIGFGKGYYDRILCRRRPHVKAVALAYELQVLDSVPTESHDIKMDMILTEARTYLPGQLSGQQ